MNTKGFTLNLGSDESRWAKLLNEIDAGNVIPVIGPDLLCDPQLTIKSDGTPAKDNIHQQIISYIASIAQVSSFPRTFSQLVYDEKYIHNASKNPIYYYISQIFSHIDDIDEIDTTPSQLLKDLLETKKFPFVITTSFTPIVENAMKEIWGDVKVLNFNNNPANSSWEQGGDIRTINELRQPTVFYMFGKVCNYSQYDDPRFVVTDSDMMKFCSSWLRGTGVPRTLVETLKTKYLLILGNNYSDWLFRFIWYGLRQTQNVMKSDIVVNDNAEETFKQFLERLETFFQESPEKVITRIKEDMKARNDSKNSSLKHHTYDTDVFISYSHTDSIIARNLCNRLKEHGLNVWFDDYSIPKAVDWRTKIHQGLAKTRLFVPILTKNVEQESIKPHEYRTEWKMAAEIAAKMGGRKFIIPFAQKGFEFYNNLTQLPDEFLKINATWFDGDSELDEITDVIISAIAEIKDLEEKMLN